MPPNHKVVLAICLIFILLSIAAYYARKSILKIAYALREVRTVEQSSV